MTTDIKELVKRLRDGRIQHSVMGPVAMREAADALEAMAKYRADYEAMKAHNNELFGKLSAAELERDRLAGKVETLKETITTAVQFNEGLAAERDRRKAALDWALGEGDEWPERKPGEGAFYWRAELRRKALGGDAS